MQRGQSSISGVLQVHLLWPELSEQIRLTGWAPMGSVVFLTSSFFTWELRIKSDSHFFSI